MTGLLPITLVNEVLCVAVLGWVLSGATFRLLCKSKFIVSGCSFDSPRMGDAHLSPSAPTVDMSGRESPQEGDADFMSDTAAPPLTGIRVLDFSQAASGPFATLFMADMGADVIKVERPGVGDFSRQMGVPMFGPQETDYVMAVNRSKRSIVIDLATERGSQLARELIAECDVVVQNYRPDVAAKLGIDFDSVKSCRPGLVYCSITGFGEGGPWGGRPANDIIIQAASGMMGVTGEFGGKPVKMGSPVADFSTGLFALAGILAALQCRDEHPEGQHVTVSMIESALAMLSNYVPRVVTMGYDVPRLGTAHAQIVPYDGFECADKPILIGAFNDGFWRSLCEALDRKEWIADERYLTGPDRLANRDSLTAELSEILRTKPRRHWQELLDAAGVPNCGLFDLDEAVRTEQVKHLGAILHLESERGSVDVVDFPPKSSAWERVPARWPATLGEHTEDVLTSVLGVAPDEIARMISDGVVA